MFSCLSAGFRYLGCLSSVVSSVHGPSAVVACTTLQMCVWPWYFPHRKLAHDEYKMNAMIQRLAYNIDIFDSASINLLIIVKKMLIHCILIKLWSSEDRTHEKWCLGAITHCTAIIKLEHTKTPSMIEALSVYSITSLIIQINYFLQSYGPAKYGNATTRSAANSDGPEISNYLSIVFNFAKLL